MAEVQLWVNGVELDCDWFQHRSQRLPFSSFTEQELVLKKGDVQITCPVQRYTHTVMRDGTEAHAFSCEISQHQLERLKK